MARLADPIWLHASTYAWGILIVVWIVLFGAMIERSIARVEGRSLGRKVLGALQGTLLALLMTLVAAAVLQTSASPA